MKTIFAFILTLSFLSLANARHGGGHGGHGHHHRPPISKPPGLKPPVPAKDFVKFDGKLAQSMFGLMEVDAQFSKKIHSYWTKTLIDQGLNVTYQCEKVKNGNSKFIGFGQISYQCTIKQN